VIRITIFEKEGEALHVQLNNLFSFAAREGEKVGVRMRDMFQ
jgi:hypothetical protein